MPTLLLSHTYLFWEWTYIFSIFFLSDPSKLTFFLLHADPPNPHLLSLLQYL